MKKSLGMVLAATMGSLIASSAMASSDTSSDPASASPSVKCMGANACKGQSACKTSTNSCKGANNCKGTGWTMTVSEEECTQKGGTVMKDETK